MRKQIGIKGREKVLENFISDINTKNVYQNYEKILKNTRSKRNNGNIYPISADNFNRRHNKFKK